MFTRFPSVNVSLKLISLLIFVFAQLLWPMITIRLSSRVYAAANHIIINEVVYNPSWLENEAEWFELYNPTPLSVNLSWWKVEEQQWTPDYYTFGSGVIIAPGETLLVVNDTISFNADFPGVIPDIDMEWSGCNSATECLRLNNSTSSTKVDQLRLLDSMSTEIDYVSWGDYGNAGNGSSLCRNTEDDTNSAADWDVCTSPTPGALSFNVLPTDIVISTTLMIENNDIWDVVGILTSVDANTGDTHTYSLVSGTGDADNGFFSISWDQLVIQTITDYEVKSSYSVRIQTDDGNGGLFAKEFLIVVVDIDELSPIVTLVWSTWLMLELSVDAYIDSWASWTDNADGSWDILTGAWWVTWSFAVSGMVNASQTGIYYIQYLKVDLTGNSGSVVRTITIQDTTTPVITVIWSTGVILTIWDSYTESGATWTDNGFTGSALISGSVNTWSTWMYLLTYYYIDPSGNMGSGLRTVTVVPPTCAPGSQLNWSWTVCQPCAPGSYNPSTWWVCMYADPGSFVSAAWSIWQTACSEWYYSATTWSLECMAAMSGSYVAWVWSTWVVLCSPWSYQAMIGQTSCIQATPWSFVATTGAFESLLCPAWTYTDVEWSTACISAPVWSFVAIGWSTWSTACIPGTYQSLTGQTLCLMADPGNYVAITWSSMQDVCPADTFSDMMWSTSCTPCPGWYSSLTGATSCADIQAPVVTVVGLTGLSILKHTNYTELWALWTDNSLTSGVIALPTSGVVIPGVIGSYVLEYAYADASGNTGYGIRTVDVVSGNLPIITLNGSGLISQEALLPYTELWAIYDDIEDGTWVVSMVSGVVNTSVTGVYLITYDYMDAQDNRATQLSRIVTITPPTCQPGRELWVASGGVVSCNACEAWNFNDVAWWACQPCAAGTFTNQTQSISCAICPMWFDSIIGSSVCFDIQAPVVVVSGDVIVTLELWVDDYVELWAMWTNNGNDGSIWSGVLTAPYSGMVNTWVVGSYLLEYYYADSAGTGVATRTVHVVDTTTPIITVIGATWLTLSVGDSYTESGAIWTDNGLSGWTVTSGTVNTAISWTYTITYSYTDPSGNTATATRTVTVINPATVDTDGDGNADMIENGGNNGWDGNGDGILDSIQIDVASTPNILTSGYTTLETTGWCSIVSDFEIITEPSLPVQDDVYSYPLWLNNFIIQCGGTWDTAIITVYYDQVYDTSQWLWRKFASGTNTYTDIGSVVSVSIGSKTIWSTPVTKVTFVITDGWLADEDGIANGTIVDPSGPAIPLVVASVPSFGGWGGYVESPLPNPVAPDVVEPDTDGGEVVPDPVDIFNPSITDWYCYTARTGINIIDSLNITTDPEFTPSLAFMYAYELTKFNWVDEFGPYTNLTREQAAKLFSNFAINVLCRRPDTSLNISYIDTVNADPTLKPYITLAYQLWLMKWGNGEFRPFDTISKAEFNAVLVRMILKSYLDESWSTWYANYNWVATDLWIITQWAGLQSVSRHNAALMLFRAYKEQEFSLQNIDYESFVLDNRADYIQ